MKSLLRMLLLICVVACPWAALAATASVPASTTPVASYQGLWWNPQEGGWGINFAHQGDIVFATWFTYDAQGKPWWLIAVLPMTAEGVYSGPVSTVAGPRFNSAPFGPAPVETEVGTMTATFADANHATIRYTVDGVTQTKAVVPQTFGPLPTCVWGAQDNLALATNYQDLWWNPQESGWGVNFTHQGDIIFATWFTYDGQGKPWWLIAVLSRSAAGAYAGPVSTVSGPAFDSVPWGAVAEAEIGSASVSFADGNAATFAYTVNGTTQTKQITRQVFAPPGTVCHASGDAFDIRLSAESLLLLPGASRDVYVTVTPRNGFTGAVALTASGLPAGVSYEISPATIAVGATAVSTVLHLGVAGTAAASGSPGIVTVAGQGGGSAHSTVALAVGVAAPGDADAVRLAAIAAVEDEARQLSGQNPAPAAFLQAISSFMAARPEYKAAGVDVETLSAWGRFGDGGIHVVTANREPASAPASAARFPALVAKALGADVPKATNARLFHSFGENFEGQAPVDDMRGYLQGKGWHVKAGFEGDARLSVLKHTAGDGFFYLNTHGGRADVGDPAEPDGKMYNIQSSTLVDPDSEKALKADRDALRVVHFTAKNGEQIKILGVNVWPDWDTRYGITYRFVDTYMSFASGSVVWINACFSTRDDPFINAFLRKGAGVYLGWSRLLNFATAYTSAPYFVDRMLGANQYTDKETPPQRAFPYDLVLQDMAKKGLDTDKLTGAKLQARLKTGLPYPPILAPSIRYAVVDEGHGELTLTGEFGPDRGKVTVGGTELGLKTWTAGEIVAVLPLTGAGSSGDVVVEVRSVRSNARQLTEWTIPLKYSWTGAYGVPEHKFEGTGSLRLRADVDGYRLIPGEAPKYGTRVAAGTRDSLLPVTGSGVHSDQGCVSTLSGYGKFLSQDQDPVPALILANAFKVAGDTKAAALGLAFGFTHSPHTVTNTGKVGCPTGSHEIAAGMGLLDGPAEFPVGPGDNPPTVPLPAVQLTLDANFGIPAKSRPFSMPGGSLNLSWPAIAAQTPPRNGDDAGK